MRIGNSLLIMMMLSGLLLAEPVAVERVGQLPAEQQPAWKSYLNRSEELAKLNEEVLQKELAVNNMTAAIAAPDGGDFKLPAKTGEAFYSTDEAKSLADIILSYQAPCGGWSKHTGYSKGARQPGMQFSSQYQPGSEPHYLCTFDNRTITEQLHYLANYYQASQREDCKTAFLKGLNYIIDAQYPNGGWPQVFPIEGKYHDDITFNDDAMTHTMNLLNDIASSQPQFDFVDQETRNKCSDSLKRAIDSVVKMQIVQDGTKTVWCAQNDPLTLQPTTARAMEPASLSGGESAKLLDFLMEIPSPSEELKSTIEGALAWFDTHKIIGMSRQKVDGKTVYVEDPNSTEIYWARFNDLKTGKPIFPGRDGVIYDTFNEMAAKNKVGYDYYITQPKSIISIGQKKWRKMLEKSGK